MIDKLYFSAKLNQHYRHCKGGIIFEDKVTYTDEEIKLIKGSDFDVQTIHSAKKYFCGTIINDAELKDLNKKYEDSPSNFKMAVDMASKLMTAGTIGRQAIYQAAQKYSISVKAIGQELGKRRKNG